MDQDGHKDAEFRQSWDACREVQIIRDEPKPNKCLQFLKWFTCSVVAAFVFLFAVLSKVLSVDSLVAAGEAILTLLAMPHLDVVTNAMVLNSVCLLSAVFQVAAESLAKERKRAIILPAISIVFTLLGYILFVISYLVMENPSTHVRTSVALAIVGTVCVSLNWWENYSARFKIQLLEEISKDMRRSQNVVCIVSGVVKIVITVAVVGASVGRSEWSSLTAVPGSVSTMVFSLVAVQIASSALCRWFVVVACKMHALRRCFLVPMYLASLAVLLILLAPLASSSSALCQNGPSQKGANSMSWFGWLMANVTVSLCTRQIMSAVDVGGLVVLGTSALSWWLGLVFSTVYIGFLKVQRLERTQDLFLMRMYEGAFLEQSMLLNTRFEIMRRNKQERHFNEDDPCIFKKKSLLPQQKIISAPYGGRLEYTLPKGNVMMVHLKDKELIRHKKRWSQVMYLYYLLGWRLNRKYFKIEKTNTYILALDGDTDFQPSAVMLLIDRLNLYPEVGAACGRIHPTGTGPMVWYQKFEYAVGHWLQKTAEHVFGCVLCSPGCFSLFRASALMDDNVMKRYTTKATEASQYVQYDQGEDRWLCTLLLQQGWRVEYNAASDAYTNAPQDFKEFYNQRRRWGPSTMANTIDLLSSGDLTSERNSSISMPYILYQVISMGVSILGPATVCMMVAGSLTFIVNMDPNIALVLATAPPVVYLALCFKLKADTQIQIAAVMSVLYAFLMTGTILSIIGDMVKQQTFMTPSGLFFISMVLLYATTAVLHPQELFLVIYGVIYFLCIPSSYLLLVIYSIVNMNSVSWGTRETVGQAKTVAESTPKRQGLWVTCCKWRHWNHGDDRSEEINENEPLLEPTMTEEKDPKVNMDSEEDEW
ncbi:uncharacterized protein LOC143502807 [Brachyhypopomus gauderio]|uniref:uncharacterized protein LOC143502807 n=1 Tax=Brachyhypopomus gauderio TaxID=698409 RepID=UPI004041012D